MTTRQKIIFAYLQATHAQVLLLAIPIDGSDQHMSPVDHHTFRKYRLMVPLFSIDEVCPVFRKACLDTFKKHTIHWKKLP